MIGVERRYKVKATIISKWLDDYRGRLMKEAMDIVNGNRNLYAVFHVMMMIVIMLIEFH
jgi:hypothetical protein